MGIWDLAKPVIAQVHGYCLAGGSELATGCDLVYVAEDAQMGYPAVRFGVPDMQFHAWFLGMRAAMEMMVTGDSISGDRGGAARVGQPGLPGRRARRRGAAGRPAHRAHPARHRAAQQAHGAPGDGRHGPAQRHPRRHRALRPRHPPGELRHFIEQELPKGLTKALQDRDAPFGDYRAAERADG